MTNFEKIKKIKLEDLVSLIWLLQYHRIGIREDGELGEEEDIMEWLCKPYDPEEW